MNKVITIKINTDNDAFLNREGIELEDILTDAVQRIAYDTRSGFYLHDSNGNMVGEVDIKEVEGN